MVIEFLKLGNKITSSNLRSKSLILIAIFILLSMVLTSNVSAEEKEKEPAPHTPDLRPSQPHIRATSKAELSANWAGYVVTGSVSDVKGSWKVPSLTCSAQTTYAAFWVGIDGFSDSTVEQTGVLAECYRREAYYYTWYEFYPSNPVYVTSSVPVKAGDTIYGEVSFSSARGLFTVTITDQTTGKTFTTSQIDTGAQRTSAEWITEAPASGRQILPLADFGMAQYGFDYTSTASTCYATVNGVTGTAGFFGSADYEITMVTSSLNVKAQPSALTSDGTSFSVTWKLVAVPVA